MKLMLLCLVILVTMTLHVVAGIHGKRGTARIMDMNKMLDKRGRGTWYTGEGLKNAACYGRKGLKPWSASVTDMIGAMAMRDFEQCYKCMQITNNDHPKLKIIVKIVDKCAGCKLGSAIDLTPKAFKMLSKGNLDIGVLNISFKPVRCPKKRGLLPDLPVL